MDIIPNGTLYLFRYFFIFQNFFCINRTYLIQGKFTKIVCGVIFGSVTIFLLKAVIYDVFILKLEYDNTTAFLNLLSAIELIVLIVESRKRETFETINRLDEKCGIYEEYCSTMKSKLKMSTIKNILSCATNFGIVISQITDTGTALLNGLASSAHDSETNLVQLLIEVFNVRLAKLKDIHPSTSSRAYRHILISASQLGEEFNTRIVLMFFIILVKCVIYTVRVALTNTDTWLIIFLIVRQLSSLYILFRLCLSAYITKCTCDSLVFHLATKIVLDPSVNKVHGRKYYDITRRLHRSVVRERPRYMSGAIQSIDLNIPLTIFDSSINYLLIIIQASGNNFTTSVLNFVPEAEDHEQFLVCRADNPRVPSSVIEDRWRLNVHYVPVATLKMGSNLNPGHIKEGEDVYFECIVKANPKAHRLTWFKGTQEISHNPSQGIILSDQSLVLQSVNRAAAGDYSCQASNSEGGASSNQVSLQVRYAPICKISNEGDIFGALKEETIQLNCVVDSSPQPTDFSWTFNGSGEQIELQSNQYTNKGYTSTLRYTPTKDNHYGTVQCSAINTVGKQGTPCVYKVVSAGRPSALQNCSIVNHSAVLLVVECTEGFDGGLPQVFYMEVLEQPSLLVRANVSSYRSPSFEVHGLDRGCSYSLNLYAVNAKGKSEVVTLYTVSLRAPDKYVGATTPLPLSPMLVSLLAVAALLCTGVCGVITALYRRHVARQHTDKHPPSANALYLERSMESLAKEHSTHSTTYCGSPKLDYSQYEMKLDGSGDIESDPDIIPSHYDKRPNEIRKISTTDDPGEELHRIFREHSLNLPPSVSSISVVNRGVTARSSDISAAQTQRPEVVTATRRVQESCI